MTLVRLPRFLLLYAFVLVLGGSIPRASAHTKITSETPSPGLTHKAPAKAKGKIDRRYAVARGNWSAATIALFNTWSAGDDNPGRHMSFYSPDRRKLVEVIENSVMIRAGGRTFNTDINNVTKHDAELGWSPDSTKFFVTWTETGELGPWHMQVYRIDESGVHGFPKVEDQARKDLERRVRHWPIQPHFKTPELKGIWDAKEYCEPYHVIGGRWLNGSEEILLSVLIRNTGDCRYMSEFNVYRVKAATGRILRRFTAVEGHKRFGDKYLPSIAH